MTLRRLPENLVNRIAAGEVVERPASAVKELVENSIDAEATHIDVHIQDGGRDIISVRDDGRGMTASDMELSIERHATSKLPSDDLLDINFLGFRGEALPSIAAVSRLKITSRTPSENNAWCLTIEGGVKQTIQPAAHSPGTLIEIRDLFFATPARLKFLKTQQTEKNRVVEVIRRLAMAHPHIGFTLTDENRALIKLTPQSGDLFDARLERLSAIMGRDFAANSIAIDAHREGIYLSGYAGLPTLNRGNGAMQFLFVNDRPVMDKVLVGAVRGAYREFLASNRYPLLALYLHCPPNQVDVNVHPAKTEVRFQDAGLVRGLIVSALRTALNDAGHRASTTVSGAALGAFKVGENRTAHSGWPARPGYSAPSPNPGLNEKVADYFAPLPHLERSLQAPPTENLIEENTSQQHLSDYPLGVARAQLHTTYVIAQTTDGIVIVDQHAAHERLVHERIKSDLQTNATKRQGLLIPEVVELDEVLVSVLMARTEELEQLGLVVEAFGQGAVIVRETPALLGDTDIQKLIRDLADDLSEFDDSISLKDRLNDVAASMACHGSVRAGRQLNADEMNALLREMEATPHAGQCSHGRPTYVELKLADIEKLFGRR